MEVGGIKGLQNPKEGGQLGSGGWAWPEEVAPREAGPQQTSRDPRSQPRSYRSARVRPQILEVGAVNGLQGLQLVGLSLRVALWWFVPAAPGHSTAPSHRNAAAEAGPLRGGGGGQAPDSQARLRNRD